MRLSIHACIAIRAKAHSSEGVNWVEIEFTDFDGKREYLSVFSEKPDLPRAIAEAFKRVDEEVLAP